MAIRSVNPATGAVVAAFDALGDTEIEERLARASATFATYRRTTFAERAGWLRRAADLLDAERHEIAVIMTTEMGKTLRSAEAEAAKCAKGMRFYAEHAPAFLADEPLADPGTVGASRAFGRYLPLGVVLAVMPWNFPLWQVVRFAAPALMAGNVGLLKHASNVPQCALYLEDLFLRAGFPAGCFQTLLIGAGQVEGVLRDPRVAAATVTGSEPAGQAVASVCGQEIKKTVLELGGSDAYVVMPSADVERAAEVAVTARCQNNGQSCIAAKRFIVHDAVYDRFAELFVAGMAALRVGDPLDSGTDVGPLATEGGRQDIEELLADAVKQGASVLCGGATPDGPGWFFPPTVVGDITTQMRLHTEEAFGPLATLYRVPDIDAAISLANVTSFGLGSNAWTADPAEQEQFINELEAGAVFLNGMVTSHPELPFGGIRRSGYGRELSAVGIREFCNLKTVWAG
ncbi:NADP-dependent succinic semialdehyde dehydrogenase [Parafrankia colletiae]|uniref:NADP-dependent succinic semialdehyde dehydrogenase n=1 Tax=Parafrankia colletiae TaxID=573497 RepID=A0A1S1QLI5_9ACTN|nr:NADP-dependent succinic semialdehyde dehydrogenase [Parafrankia colletiae]MCK9900939.1 NADP-dependent succinic semialdehyde dehydrogenase [Frankia sp. Cpl3]OHV34557.1 NADP-dependent succinic semialdehyde dehydrogenase [Parafrankia colletiae]